MIIYSATDTEQPTVNFTLYMKRDITKRENRNTIKKYSDDFITNIIRMAINDRIEMLVRKENSPFISASVRDGNFFLASTKDVFEISAVLKAVSYTHLTLPTTARRCRSRWSPYH